MEDSDLDKGKALMRACVGLLALAFGMMLAMWLIMREAGGPHGLLLTNEVKWVAVLGLLSLFAVWLGFGLGIAVWRFRGLRGWEFIPFALNGILSFALLAFLFYQLIDFPH